LGRANEAGEGALHYPAAWKNHKPFLVNGAQHHLQTATAVLDNPVFDSFTNQAACRGLLWRPARRRTSARSVSWMGLPGMIVAASPKTAIDALPFGLLFGQHAPLDAAHDHIQDSIDDLAHLQAAQSSSGFGRWDQRLENTPLGVAQVGRA